MRQLAQHDAISKFAREMIEAGILERAEQETELQIGSFVSALTGKATHIVFESRDGEIELPLSCQPITPRGWVKEPDGAWKKAS